MQKASPQLPQGNAGVWQGISENFAFHASPESFIESRILEYQQKNPDLVESRTPVRAKILNRNVAIISSYRQVKSILEDSNNADREPGYIARDAYDDLMSSFFPPPNLLLADGAQHKAMRDIWSERARKIPNDIETQGRRIIRKHFESLVTVTEFDLYDSMKYLAWKLLLGSFLGVAPDDAEFGQYQKLHEDLLRGQFSLLPVSINVGFWHSPRKSGIEARKKLQELILSRLKSMNGCCPFNLPDGEAIKDVADHILLFTSSLAVKGLSSLLTALLLNIYVHRSDDGRRLADVLVGCKTQSETRKKLNNILAETERLSPPIVGIMRRSARENIVEHSTEQSDTLVPKGWDVWLYFVGAGRDPAVFGDTSNLFDANRYEDNVIDRPLAFGAGSKTCLGQPIARNLVILVAEMAVEMGIDLKASELPCGVRGWLGWESTVSAEDWAADMKQLPTQRPARPVQVKLSR